MRQSQYFHRLQCQDRYWGRKFSQSLSFQEISLPIQDSITKGPGLARSLEEEVPNSLCEGLGILIRCKDRAPSSTSKTERDNLSLVLACLDIASQTLAISECRAFECTVIVSIAGLKGGVSVNFDEEREHVRTLAMLISGNPPAEEKTFKNANGKTSIVSS